MDQSEHNPVDHPADNSITAIWSMMLPGVGQLMKGQVMAGIFWSVFVGFGYFSFFWPGLILHALCILDAAFNKGEKSWSGDNSWLKKSAFAALILCLLTYIVIRNF
jgi:hypothetical protein